MNCRSVAGSVHPSHLLVAIDYGGIASAELNRQRVNIIKALLSAAGRQDSPELDIILYPGGTSVPELDSDRVDKVEADTRLNGFLLELVIAYLLSVVIAFLTGK